MRIAILGTGLMARVRAQHLLSDPRVTWIGLASRSAARAEDLAGQLGASASGSIEDILATPLDAVMISGASDDRASQVRLVLPGGVPIFCEKPLATDLDDCRKLLHEAAAMGVEIQVGFQRRFDREYAAAKKLIQSGELGSVYGLNLTSHDHEPPPEQFVATSGGLFSDLGVHDYDLARWLTGEEVDEVYAAGSYRTEWEYFGRHQDPDTAVTVLRMTSGLPVVVSTSRHSPDGHDVRAEIFGSRHNVAVGQGDYTPLRSPVALSQDQSIRAYPNFLTRFEQAFTAQTTSFLDWIDGLHDNPCPASAGLESLRIAAAADRSWRQNRPVSLEEV